MQGNKKNEKENIIHFERNKIVNHADANDRREKILKINLWNTINLWKPLKVLMFS